MPMEKEPETTFRVGQKVFYPSRGPCVIGALVKKTVAGEAIRFYPISSLDDAASAILIPFDKLAGLAMRQLLRRSEIPTLLGRLNHSLPASKNWKQRVIDNAKLFASGSPFDLARIVQSLTELNENKELSLRDRQTLEKARGFLICEISEVLEESRDTATRQVDPALARKKTSNRDHEVCAGLFKGCLEPTMIPEEQCTHAM